MRIERALPDDPPLPGADAQGLDSAAVAAARQVHGFNDIVAEQSRGWVAVASDTARDPMLWFLLVSAALFALLGQSGESWTLLLALLPLLGMDAYLHHRTAVSAAGLASRLAATSRVLRDGRWGDVASRELVPGDLVEVAPGTYFPADGVFVGGAELQSDESTLTGESLPVHKKAIAGAPWRPSQRIDETHWGSAGTRLLTGTARLRVVYTGARTRYGEIARAASDGRRANTPLQRAIARLVATLLVVALGLCLVLAGARVLQGHGWIDAALSAVTLAVAAIPEEFPVVYTFFLGAGVFRLARRKALVRHAVAVENIGRVSCIVSDKTGTITAGTLVLAHCLPAPGHDEASLRRIARLAARADSGDPLDEALGASGAQDGEWLRKADFPFTEARRHETVLWGTPHRRVVACTKGAPETVLGLCRLGDDETAHWLRRVDALAAAGHKVIACAHLELPEEGPMEEPRGGFALAGLLAFEDPVRPGAEQAMAACMSSGIRVVMVTGDHPATAAAIAREVGLGGEAPRVVVLGADASVAGALSADVVARATPAQKLALVRALQAQGELVAVTGDGVNDVPALRQADIGVAMGERGTRSAREAAAIVLLDDNLRTLVDAVAEGRQLFVNLRLAFAYLLLVHLPLVVGAAVIPLLDLPLLYLPVHIVWLELVIHPTAMLAFQDLPSRGPLGRADRHRRARFFSGRAWLHIVGIGGFACLAVMGGYLQALGAEHDVAHGRSMAMVTLLLCATAFAAVLSGLRNPAARWMALGTSVSLVLLVQVPSLSNWLHLRPLHLADWGLAIASAGLAGLGTRYLLARSIEADDSRPWRTPGTS